MNSISSDMGGFTLDVLAVLAILPAALAVRSFGRGEMGTVCYGTGELPILNHVVSTPSNMGILDHCNQLTLTLALTRTRTCTRTLRQCHRPRGNELLLTRRAKTTPTCCH